MDRSSPGEVRGAAGPITTAAAATAIPTSAATNTTRPPTPSRTQPLSPAPTDRQAVIQQPVQRAQSTAAQYLQQMYAAQQQHILLQTAALQQQQQQQGTASQSLTTTQQASQTVSKPPPSSPSSTNGNLSQSVSVSQTSITLATTPLTAQPIGRIQGTCSNPAGGTISQQAMLLGNGSASGSQAQMYLRTQMLILAPTAPVAAVPSDLPAVSATSSQPTSTQVQTLALRTHLPGALAQGVSLKPCLQSQTVASSLPKMSISQLKSSQLSHTTSDSSRSDLGQVSSTQQLITPCPRGTHQFIIQQGASAHRQMQPIALRVKPQEQPPPLSLQARPLLTQPPPASASQSQLGEVLTAAATSTSEQQQQQQQQQPQGAVLVSSASGSSAQAVRPLLQLAPLGEALPLTPHASAQNYGSITTTAVTTNPLQGSLTCPSPTPTSLQRLSLRSVQALAVESGQVLVSEEELPVAEALVQLPFQNLPPPQTVAVDLKMQSVSQTVTAQGPQTEHKGTAPDRTEESPRIPRRQSQTPTRPTLSPSAEVERGCEEDAPCHRENCTAGLDSPCMPSSQFMMRSPEEVPLVTSSPLPLHPAVVRSTSKPPATSLPESPEGQPSQAVAKPHILTHLIEGFVIHEGLEPFPVSHSSLTEDEQAALPESQEVTANGDPEPDDDLMDVDMDPDNSSDSDMDDLPADDEHLGDSLSDLLQCEFCGKRGYTHSFLRSKRFCSMTCVRRFNVSCTRRLGLLRTNRASRWPHRPMGRRGRPPGRADGISREHFLRQLPARLDGEDDDEDEPPGPMTTRLRRQAEREREQEQQRKERRRESFDSDEFPVVTPNPSQWTVEQVCAYINSIPGCAVLGEEFRSQEIDGQALLLLTEDHLVSAMNIKLGPALKICAQINSLKGP